MLTFQDKIFLTVIYLMLALVSATVLIPVLYTFSVAFTPYHELMRKGGVILWPRKITLEYFNFIFGSHSPILKAYANSAVITLLGTAASLFVTILTAYPLSKKYLPGRNIIMAIFFFTMLFHGGLIPTYMVVRGVKLIDKIGALILPSLMMINYIIILRTFFTSIPESLEESAKIDGCSDIGILFKIVIPLSLPAIATFALFYAVARWNSWFDVLIYINDRSKYTLQIVLREILLLSQVTELTSETAFENMPPLLSLQMATTVVAILPMMILYPFLQKYFVKGIMIGAVKG